MKTLEAEAESIAVSITGTGCILLPFFKNLINVE
jgi:hypothetical protein